MIGERLKMLRLECGYSQSYVAKSLNMSRETYSKYERGVRNPSIDTLIAIASLYGVSLDYLLSRTDFKMPYSGLDGAKQKAVLAIVSCSNLFAKIIVEVARLDKR